MLIRAMLVNYPVYVVTLLLWLPCALVWYSVEKWCEGRVWYHIKGEISHEQYRRYCKEFKTTV